MLRAEKELTKYPYSLLFSFLRLVKEPHEPSTLDDWVPAEQALEWCSRYGLPATEAQLYIAGMDCLRLDRFQRETAILYWLFQLWNSIFKFFQVDSTGMVRMTSAARYFKYGVGSSRPSWR